MRETFALLTIVFLASCDNGSRNPTASQPPAVPAYQLPTATEVFNLRTECARLGEKALNDNHIGVALTQSQVSNYNQKTNRCYVALTVQTGNMNVPMEYLHTTLYDGQTGEQLAFIKIEKGQKVGMVFKKVVPAKKNDEAGFEAARDYISEMMKDD